MLTSSYEHEFLSDGVTKTEHLEDVDETDLKRYRMLAAFTKDKSVAFCSGFQLVFAGAWQLLESLLGIYYNESFLLYPNTLRNAVPVFSKDIMLDEF